MERIRKERSQGKTAMQMIDEWKGAFSAWKASSSDLTQVGKSVFDRMNKHIEDKKRIAQDKGDAAQVALKNKRSAVDKLKSLGISRDKLTISHIKTLLAPLKR